MQLQTLHHKGFCVALEANKTKASIKVQAAPPCDWLPYIQSAYPPDRHIPQ